MCVVGIDIGTSYAYLAISKNREVNVVESIEGRRIVSCVGFNEHERLVGVSAVYQMAKNPENIITGLKQLLGKNMTNTPASCSFKLEQCDDSIKVVANYRGKARIFYPEQLFAMILSKLKTIAENANGEKITAAVITVPPHFNTAQRVAIKDSANIAGIHVLGLLSETLAAAIDYEQRLERGGVNENVMILHVGGGGFDVTILSVEKGCIRTLSNIGAADYGGIFLTNVLWEAMKEKIYRDSKIKIDNDAKAKYKLWEACEKAKLDLTLGKSTSIRIDALSNGRDYSCDINRKDFNQLIDESMKYIVMSAMKAMNQAQVTAIHKLFFVGGGTRVPLLREKLFTRFPAFKDAWRKTITVDEAPVHGAAVWAEHLTRPIGKRIDLRTPLHISDVLSFDLIAEMKDVGKISIASKGSAIPATYWITDVGVAHRPYPMQLMDVGDSPEKISSSGVCTVSEEASLIMCSIGIDGIPELSAHFHGTKESLSSIGLSVEKKKTLTKEVTLIDHEEMNNQKRSFEMHQLERFAYNLQQKYSGRQAKCEDILNWIREHPDAGLDDITSKRHALDQLAAKLESDKCRQEHSVADCSDTQHGIWTQSIPSEGTSFWTEDAQADEKDESGYTYSIRASMASCLNLGKGDLQDSDGLYEKAVLPPSGKLNSDLRFSNFQDSPKSKIKKDKKSRRKSLELESAASMTPEKELKKKRWQSTKIHSNKSKK